MFTEGDTLLPLSVSDCIILRQMVLENEGWRAVVDVSSDSKKIFVLSVQSYVLI